MKIIINQAEISEGFVDFTGYDLNGDFYTFGIARHNLSNNANKKGGASLLANAKKRMKVKFSFKFVYTYDITK